MIPKANPYSKAVELHQLMGARHRSDRRRSRRDLWKMFSVIVRSGLQWKHLWLDIPYQ